MKNGVSTLGRYMLAVVFLVFGLMHFMKADAMQGMVPTFIPGGVFWVYITGLALVAGAISIMIQKYTRIACILLGIMLVVFVLTIHLPSAMSSDPAMMQMGMSNLLKDTAIAGGVFVLAGNYE